ncbi:carbohydrate-binding module family 20 domain-containing protein [Glycomyces paridis]|uniref:Alpha-amylase n=1 Tax=Glycomyces paridis TaxID=2126555 RepID=A0A4S8P254_9ACTN|nr:carbohydrate-binding module family 20 domain-containing protein [Glycomyces paridis]THV21704.1 glycosidase [Glycomyces paridis]
MSRVRTGRRAAAVAGALAVAAGALVAGPATAQEVEAAAPAVTGDSSIIELFEWNWNSIAQECTDFLGDSGYTHIKVSPPQEHILASDTNTPDNWWIQYQPVSYELDSRLGTRAEFESMVDTCAAEGVGIIADVVINHMAAGSTSTRYGQAGSEYRQFDYPAAGYDASDFHNTGSSYCEISDYTNRWQVQNCHLVGLNDLATEQDDVRATIAAYLQDLLDVGVVGFRVDASKHMPAADLENIFGRLSGDPYVTHEVIYAQGSNEPIVPSEYYGSGTVQQFDFSRWMRNHFAGESKASYLLNLGESWGLSPDDKAQVFVQNHDSPRGGDAGNYLDYYTGGKDYLLANAYMMAYDYGVPSQMSDYSYSNKDQGPNLVGGVNSEVADVDCDAVTGRWTCQHRGAYFAGMAGFRESVAGTAVNNKWHNDEDAFGFGRGSAGYVVLNSESSSVSATFTTSMPAGQYCNVLGTGTVTVGAGGTFTATVGADEAIAIHIGAPYVNGACEGTVDPDPDPDPDPGDGTVCVDVNVNATTWFGQEVYITGSLTQLGTWTAASTAHLGAQDYPVWRGTVTLPAETTFEYKYIKVAPGGALEWESGTNRTFTTPTDAQTTCATLNDTWRS